MLIDKGIFVSLHVSILMGTSACSPCAGTSFLDYNGICPAGLCLEICYVVTMILTGTRVHDRCWHQFRRWDCMRVPLDIAPSFCQNSSEVFESFARRPWMEHACRVTHLAKRCHSWPKVYEIGSSACRTLQQSAERMQAWACGLSCAIDLWDIAEIVSLYIYVDLYRWLTPNFVT